MTAPMRVRRPRTRRPPWPRSVRSRSMRGALAAGNPLTAEAGADVLRAGGNAVDACIAATAVSWICESPLTGPGGGGFLLVHTAREARTRLLDFFVAVPERTAAREDVVLNEVQAFLHRILDPLLRFSPEGDALYGHPAGSTGGEAAGAQRKGVGRALVEGERFAVPELADTLEQIAAEGADYFYRGELAERIAAHVPVTLADLARYEVIEREPL